MGSSDAPAAPAAGNCSAASSSSSSSSRMSMSMVVAGDLGSPDSSSSTLFLGSSRTDWGLLPQALLEEVLRRLPIASQLRFRSVSKRWLGILTSPAFLWECVPREPAPAALLALQARFKLEERAEHPYPLSTPLSFHGLPPLRELPGRLLPCASDAGLVCFFAGTQQQGGGFFMLNPMTRAWRRLPDGPPLPSSVALRVDRASKSYTVVVAASAKEEGQDRVWTLHLYEASKDGWEEGGRTPRGLRPERPAFCRGMLYFVGCEWEVVGWSVEAREWDSRRLPAPAGVECARLLSHQGELLWIGLLAGSFTSYGIWRLLPDGAWRQVALLTSSFFQALFPDCGARDNSWGVFSLGESVCLDLRLYDFVHRGEGSHKVDPVGRRVLLAFDFSIKAWFVMPLQFQDTLDSKSRTFLLSFQPRLDSIV